MDRVSKIMAYEAGELNDADTIELFQELVDSGLAWKLQGSYGRRAHELIEAGVVRQFQRVSTVAQQGPPTQAQVEAHRRAVEDSTKG